MRVSDHLSPGIASPARSRSRTPRAPIKGRRRPTARINLDREQHRSLGYRGLPWGPRVANVLLLLSLSITTALVNSLALLVRLPNGLSVIDRAARTEQSQALASIVLAGRPENLNPGSASVCLVLDSADPSEVARYPKAGWGLELVARPRLPT